jgi:hypothetical protein
MENLAREFIAKLRAHGHGPRVDNGHGPRVDNGHGPRADNGHGPRVDRGNFCVLRSNSEPSEPLHPCQHKGASFMFGFNADPYVARVRSAVGMAPFIQILETEEIAGSN